MTAKRKCTKLKTLRLTLEESGYKLSELMYPSKGLEDSICDAMNRYTQQELESKEQEIENLKRELKEANDELRSIAEDEAGADL